MLNKLRRAIEENGHAVGTFLGVSTPSIVEILGYTGLDFVVIDTEHGPYDTMPVSDLIRASQSRGMAPVVRVADVTHKEIQRAVKAACIESLVEDIGLQAILGERGMGLSEGQAQRVAIARALLSGAPILLLDESTSALDEETEAKLLANISAMRDKTCFIVTHRKAAMTICDYELHIAEGRMSKRDC